jgi:acyl-CoA reductase-like NAD-dependent aldehyde dehydrogenase
MAVTAAEILKTIPPVSEYRWSCKDVFQQFTVVNPATGKPITVVQAGNPDTADKAIQASQKAFESWRWKTRQERSVYLIQAADELQKHIGELAILLCLENGKPVKDASFDLMFMSHMGCVWGFCRSIGLRSMRGGNWPHVWRLAIPWS